MKKPFRQILLLDNPVMEYAWGSFTFIPELLGRPSPSPKPAAELWMGAHPRAPSRVMIGDEFVSLDRFVRDNPLEILGPPTADKFGDRLPFLLKILAVERPLSIQAHPDRTRARQGWQRENAAGIPLDGPERNYRDPEAKPELISALTSFEAFCGFRPPDEIAATLAGLDLDSILPAAQHFAAEPHGGNLRSLFRNLLALTPPEKDRLLHLTAEVIDHPEKTFPVPAAARNWFARLRNLYPGDIGAFVSLLLNYVRLEPGEALFLAPGEIHAYLGGAGVEIMASSDNVLRGGLTVKHIDGPELCRVLSCSCGAVSPLRPDAGAGVETVYPCPAEDFRLSRLFSVSSEPFLSRGRGGPEIVFCYRGRARAEGGAGPTVDLTPGSSIFIPFAVGEYSLQGEAVLYRASLPAG